MKKTKWNKSWTASVQPRKQRLYLRNAPRHIQGDFVASHLSKELKQKHKHRALRIKVGDKVKIVRGTLKSKTGKVERIDVRNKQVFITGIELTKRDGSKAMRPLNPSNLIIQELNLSDKRRLGAVKA